MQLSWKLGRIAGIDVFVHPTFLLILFFPGVLSGGLLSLLLVLSRLRLRLAASSSGMRLMARRFGIETEDITLYPIGGVARLRRLPRAPGAELLIALAGPAVNFAIVGAPDDPGIPGPRSRSCWCGLGLVLRFLSSWCSSTCSWACST